MGRTCYSLLDQPPVIEPDTPIEESTIVATGISAPAINRQGLTATTMSIIPAQWYIHLTDLKSEKSAHQHIARIWAMGIESTAVRISDKGRIRHHIRITGFNSRGDAAKQLTKISKNWAFERIV